VDALLTLRFDAGMITETGSCLALGTGVRVEDGVRMVGDIDCTGAIDPLDGLKLLRYDGGLSVAQEPNCVEIGSLVTVALIGN
jgi:hypothetical protein